MSLYITQGLGKTSGGGGGGGTTPTVPTIPVGTGTFGALLGSNGPTFNGLVGNNYLAAIATANAQAGNMADGETVLLDGASCWAIVKPLEAEALVEYLPDGSQRWAC